MKKLLNHKQLFCQPSQRFSALTAGIAIAAMAIVAGFSFGFVFKELIVPNDEVGTLSNLKNSPLFYNLGTVGWVIILLLDLVTAWAMFHFLKATNASLSFVAAAFRVIYAVFLGIGIVHLIKVTFLLDSPKGTGILSEIETFQTIWLWGLIAFGFHLILLGIAVFKSDFGSKTWGILLLLAGVSYQISNIAKLLCQITPEFESNMDIVLSIPMIIGELGFGIWLLLKGGKTMCFY